MKFTAFVVDLTGESPHRSTDFLPDAVISTQFGTPFFHSEEDKIREDEQGVALSPRARGCQEESI